MKLLFDQNLSHRLTRSLSDVYCDCRHARHVGLKEAPDSQVWQFARNNGYTIVSKDSDFHQRSLLYGFPPKIVWVRLGNCSTKAVEKVLRAHCDELKRFHADETATFLIIFP